MGDCLSKPKLKADEKIPCSDKSSIAQPFCLPSSIVYYITNNPSGPKCYSKMIQSCKYFYERNPILIIKCMDDARICPNDDKICRNNEGECCLKYDITKSSSKIWLLEKLDIPGREISNFASVFLSKIYRCEIDNLTISNTNMSFDDFKILASTPTKVYFLGNVKMTYGDGKFAVLETILEAIPNVNFFQYTLNTDYHVINSSTIRNIMKLKNLGNLQCFYLNNISEVLNIQDLSKFIKNRPGTKFYFIFRDDIPQACKDQVDALIDMIIESKVSRRLVYYTGLNKEKHVTMCESYNTPF